MKKFLSIMVLMLISMSAFASDSENVTGDYDMPAVFRGCSIYEMRGGFMDYPMVAMYCPSKDVSNASVRVSKVQVGMPVVMEKGSPTSGIFIDKDNNQVITITCQNMKGTLVCTKG